VFDSVTGCLLDTPSIDAIHALRQICLLFGKVNLPCNTTRTAAAIRKYVECEKDVRLQDKNLDPILLDQFKQMSWSVFQNVFNLLDRKVFEGDLIPKHGPGATADRLFGNEKYEQAVWTRRLERVFPHEEYLFPSWNPLVDSSDVDILEPGAEIPVRVITVPKTLKTPRIIAIEPTCMQYMQQALMRELVSSIERDDFLSVVIGFDDQIPNQEMAREGSLKGALATLDLSEASDRVSNQLVRGMVEPWHWLASAVDATRSRKADVPGFGVLRLAKYASMGSALCFPFEAMVFFTIILLGIQDELRHPLSSRDISSLLGKVRVYGDDIIVPVEFVRSVTEKLQAFGLVVNLNKSFWTGRFRESCGKEYFSGEDVSIVRVRENLPTSRRHVQEIMSTVSLRNQMYFAGNWETAAWLDEWLGKLIPFPVVLPTSPALGRHSFLGYSSERECPRLHKPLVRAYRESSTPPLSHLDGRGALLKYFLLSSGSNHEDDYQPATDGNHLERAGRPKTVNIKLGWVSST